MLMKLWIKNSKNIYSNFDYIKMDLQYYFSSKSARLLKIWEISMVIKSEFYTLNYKINNKIFKFNYHWYINKKDMNLIFLNDS